MEKKISEVDITWSSIEASISYSRVIWYTNSNGIPRYIFYDVEGNRINL